MKSSTWITAAIVSIAGQAVAADKPLSIDSDDDIKASAGRLAKGMLKYYKGNEPGNVPGILPGPPPKGDYYWYEAGLMWASLIDYWHYTGDDSHNDLVAQALLFQRGEYDNYEPQNQTLTLGNDDQAAWGHAAMLAVERNFPKSPEKNAQWLDLAKTVFDALAGRWDNKTCNGGLRWQIPSFNAGYDYKNVAANGALFNLAARLGRYTNNSTYVDWANTSWDWMAKVGFLNSSSYDIYDGAHVEDNCKRVDPVQFTYASGTLLNGAANMFNHTGGDNKWRDRVNGLIENGSKLFFKQGVVQELDCELAHVCKSDMKSFKGNMLRDYAHAAQLAPFTTEKISFLLKSTAAAAIKNCGDPDKCEFSWTGHNAKRDNDDNGDDGDNKNVDYDKSTASEEMNALNAVSVLLFRSSSPPAAAVNDKSSSGNAGSSDGSKDGKESKDSKKSAGVKSTYSVLSAVTAISALLFTNAV